MATEETKTEVTFTKQQILTAKRYNDRCDLLNVLLIDDQQYMLADVDKAIEAFMKKGVK